MQQTTNNKTIKSIHLIDILKKKQDNTNSCELIRLFNY
jgi:hypothetical protein